MAVEHSNVTLTETILVIRSFLVIYTDIIVKKNVTSEKFSISRKNSAAHIK